MSGTGRRAIACCPDSRSLLQGEQGMMSHTSSPHCDRVPPHLCIPQMLEYHTRHCPQAPAVLAPGRPTLTYGRLHQHVQDTAQTLHAMGWGCHDRLALVLPNGPEMTTAFLAVASVTTCIPLNPAYTIDECAAYLANVRAQAVLVQAGMDASARAAARQRDLPIIELAPVFEAEAGMFVLTGERRAPAASPVWATPDDVALVLLTSGTTAQPRLAPLTHATICTAAHHMGAALALAESDRLLSVMPLFHSH